MKSERVIFIGVERSHLFRRALRPSSSHWELSGPVGFRRGLLGSLGLEGSPIEGALISPYDMRGSTLVLSSKVGSLDSYAYRF